MPQNFRHLSRDERSRICVLKMAGKANRQQNLDKMSLALMHNPRLRKSSSVVLI